MVSPVVVSTSHILQLLPKYGCEIEEMPFNHTFGKPDLIKYSSPALLYNHYSPVTR